jgi:hypothetical protein
VPGTRINQKRKESLGKWHNFENILILIIEEKPKLFLLPAFTSGLLVKQSVWLHLEPKAKVLIQCSINNQKPLHKHL